MTQDLTAPTITACINEWYAALERIDDLQNDLAAERTLVAALQAENAALQHQLTECQKPQPETPLPAPREVFMVDPAFSADMLSGEQQMWRNRLLATFGENGVTYPSLNDIFAGTGSAKERPTYALGYQTIIEAYALVIDAIGDPAVFAEINRLMNLINHERIVYTTDLEESYVIRLFAVYAHLLHVNQHEDAVKWLDLTRQRIAKRSGIVGNNGLAQCAINNALASWCLWLITGDAAYKATVAERLEWFRARFLYDAERGLWWHAADNAVMTYESPTWWGEKIGAQWTTYVRYDLMGLLMLWRLGCEVLPPALIAERVGELYRDDGTIALRLDGSDAVNPYNGAKTGWTKGAQGWITSSFALCWMWNDRVRAASIAAWESVAGHETMPFVPAAMMSRKG